MNVANDSEAEVRDPDAIWLELTFEGQPSAFELPADETRAIVVGSLPRADLRIDRPGVAPVHFYFERENNELWIVPGYSPESLRVDTARVSGARRIDSRAVIEFCGVRLKASVLEEPPVPRRRTSLTHFRQSGVSERGLRGPSLACGEHEPGAAESTGDVPSARLAAAPTIAIDRLASRAPAQIEQSTTRFWPLTTSIECAARTVIIDPCRVVPLEAGHEKEPISLRTGEVPAGPVTVIPSPVSISDLMPTDTIETRPFWLDEPGPELVAQPSRTVNAPYHERPADKRSTVPASCGSKNSAPITPGAIYVVGESGASTNTPSLPVVVSPQKKTLSQVEPALGSVAPPAENPHAPHEAETQQTSHFEPMRISEAPFGPGAYEQSQETTASELLATGPKHPLTVGWLSHLGTLSTRRPLLVWLAGTITVFAVSAGIASISHHPRPAPYLTKTPPPASTARQAAATASVTPATPAQAHGPTPLAVIAATSTPPNVKLKKGEPANPGLVSAIEALISGHYVEARAAYARLSAEAPNELVFQTTTALLEKKLAPECSIRSATSTVSCPEVKP